MPLHRWTDDQGLDSDTHAGANGTTIYVANKNFDLCGVKEGLAVKNLFTGETGLVQSGVTPTQIPTNINFDTGERFIVYCTGTVDKALSSYGTDRTYGDFVESPDQLDEDGYLPKWRDDPAIKSGGTGTSPEQGIKDKGGSVIHGADGQAIVGA